ncbi:MAG: hypothetical protein EPO16_12435 [Dehalococcoidia bacterium]|nr:MAG: hypothetical protein EPO16_12435 [Dehalococcoidia bacterium]
MPLTYIAASGAREDYESHVESLAGALEMAAHRFRSGGQRGTPASLAPAPHESPAARVAPGFAVGAARLDLLAFYAAGLRAR